MDCATVRGQLAAYRADFQSADTLPAESRQAIQAHLATCAACRAELALLDEIDEALATWPLLAEPEGFTARVMDEIRAGKASKSARPHLPIRWQDAVLGLALVLTLVALLLAVRTPFLLRRVADDVEWGALDLQFQRSLSAIEGTWYTVRTDVRHAQAGVAHVFGWVSGAIVLAAATATAGVLVAQWHIWPRFRQ
jgi:anti-sigma factor RsiW